MESASEINIGNNNNLSSIVSEKVNIKQITKKVI